MIFGKISVEPRVRSVDVVVFTRGGTTTGDDGSIPQVWLDGRKKVQFDVKSEKDMFFEAHDTIRREPVNFYVYTMPHVFFSTLVVGPLRQHGTLQNFFECCLSLAKDIDAISEIASLLHRPKRGHKDYVVNFLHKKKNGKETRMNI